MPELQACQSRSKMLIKGWLSLSLTCALISSTTAIATTNSQESEMTIVAGPQGSNTQRPQYTVTYFSFVACSQLCRLLQVELDWSCVQQLDLIRSLRWDVPRHHFFSFCLWFEHMQLHHKHVSVALCCKFQSLSWL